jgi:hypothetical protein
MKPSHKQRKLTSAQFEKKYEYVLQERLCADCKHHDYSFDDIVCVHPERKNDTNTDVCDYGTCKAWELEEWRKDL